MQQPQGQRTLAVALQFSQRAFKQHPPMVDDAYLLHHLLHLAQQMAGDQHSGSGGGGHGADEFPHLLDTGGVQAVGGFVQHQQLGAAQQGHGDAQPLLHAQRILPHLAVLVIGQLHNVQHTGNVLVGHTF